jgi:hypothetical protein
MGASSGFCLRLKWWWKVEEKRTSNRPASTAAEGIAVIVRETAQTEHSRAFGFVSRAEMTQMTGKDFAALLIDLGPRQIVGRLAKGNNQVTFSAGGKCFCRLK